MRILRKLWLFGAVFCSLILTLHAQTKPAPLRLERVIKLPGIQGSFDHLAFDPALKRLFVAAEDQGVVVVVDLKGEKVRTIPGFVHPHSILVQQEDSRIFVTDSGDGASAFVNARTLNIMRRVPLALGANCILYDSQKHRVYVTAGGDRVQQNSSTLQSIDSESAQVIGSVPVSALHLQPMALDAATDRLFVNLADQDRIAIYDRNTLKQTSSWPLPDGHRNSPIAIDDQHHRIFVIATTPGLLLELNSISGALIASASTAPDPDDMDFETSAQRIYVPGDGFLDVYAVGASGEIRSIQHLETGPGARTGNLIQSAHKYVVAVPSSATQPARLLVYAISE